MDISQFKLIACMTGLAIAAFAGPPGGGIFFDAHTYYEVPQSEINIDPTGFSLSCWVKTTVSTSQIFLNMGAAGTGFTLYLYDADPAVRMLVEHNPPVYTSAKALPTPPNTWTHYIGTYDGSSIKIYTNGALRATTLAAINRTTFPYALQIGAVPDKPDRMMNGWMEDIRIWNRPISAGEVASVYQAVTTGVVTNDLIACWNSNGIGESSLISQLEGGPDAYWHDPEELLQMGTPGAGFNGIWYYNQRSGDQYVYKYSGGLGTYCAKHIPMAWYSAQSNRTYFCYGGTDNNNSTLFHMVSYFDHNTGKVARPTCIMDKHTDDAHDNPVINLDTNGYIWIFHSSHGVGRPSYITRSVNPHDIRRFRLMYTGNFSYPQPFYYPGKGFMFMHTWYSPERGMFLMTSNPDGTEWSGRKMISYIERGHYQVSRMWQGIKTGTAFNMHPNGLGLNYRTNLYYMESDDFGETWKSVDGKVLETPLTEAESPALVAEYKSKGLNVYMKDMQFDSKGNPLILVVTSKGYEAGPANGPREWMLFHWNGKSWDAINTGIKSGNNYDTGSVYVESDTAWRIIGPTRLGPQPYNPGGEISMWLTQDAGSNWPEIRKITDGSERNHTYVRAPINAHPDFYGYWADGHGRKPSKSCLYFCNQRGEAFRLPDKMEGAMARPEPVFR
ncbi:MAG: BNR-4 repeat-containing protein [Kiritimatiellae bacterium]|nr:BNR-4 repeat-containing protein [Kiritimatiellia bacterium]